MASIFLMDNWNAGKFRNSTVLLLCFVFDAHVIVTGWRETGEEKERERKERE